MKELSDMSRKRIVVALVLFLAPCLMLAGCGGGGGGASAGTATIQMGGARQGATPALTGLVTILAGRPAWMSPDGTGAQAQFDYPYGITSDGYYLYVADTANQIVRKVDIATGEVTTLAGSVGETGSVDGTGSAARFAFPTDITTDGINLYVLDSQNQTVRKVAIATGAVTTLAGSAGQSGSSDGTGSAARFNSPEGLTVSGTSLYVADTGNSTIRAVSTITGQVTTLAGSAGQTGYTDNTGSAARFDLPTHITNDGVNIYVVDKANHVIRVVTIATAAVTTLAGTPILETVNGMTVYEGILYTSDFYDETINSILLSTGQMTTLAGNSGVKGSADGIGSAATFTAPSALTTVGSNIYVTDTDSNTIRKVAIATGAVTTLAGSPPGTDGNGPAALFNYPSDLTTDGTNLYVADTENYTIRRIAIATGAVTTLAGSVGVSAAADGVGTAANFRYPVGLTTDGANLFITDTIGNTIRKLVIATGQVTTMAGKDQWTGSSDGTGTAALFDGPAGITTDGINLYVADTDNSTIRKIVIATGQVTTLAGSPGVNDSFDAIGPAAQFNYPCGITTDGTNLYVADTNNSTIRQVVIATRTVTTLAGSPGVNGAVDGYGSAAQFSYPTAITTDGTNLYVADTDNNTIRKVVIATGEVSTVTGGGANSFSYPSGITTGGTALYVADTDNSLIRLVR
jgi:sugar lactone lactonase YvrE